MGEDNLGLMLVSWALQSAIGSSSLTLETPYCLGWWLLNRLICLPCPQPGPRLAFFFLALLSTSSGVLYYYYHRNQTVKAKVDVPLLQEALQLTVSFFRCAARCKLGYDSHGWLIHAFAMCFSWRTQTMPVPNEPQNRYNQPHHDINVFIHIYTHTHCTYRGWMDGWVDGWMDDR